MASFAKKIEVKFGGYSTFWAYMQSPEYIKIFIKTNLQFKLRKILKMCVKCDEKVPHSYLCGETDPRGINRLVRHGFPPSFFVLLAPVTYLMNS